MECEVELIPGRYVVLPRTSGALMTKPLDWNSKPRTTLIDENGDLTLAFSHVVEDIFRKFDLFIGRELSYEEFKVFY